MKILFFGDIMGKAGRAAIKKALPQLREEHKPDLVLANAENLSHGKGVTLKTITEMLEAGIDFFTSGNHVFDKPEGKDVFEKFADKIIRPANMPKESPGQGWKIFKHKNQSVLIINLLGQVFMNGQFDFGEIENPFLSLNEILSQTQGQANIRILDFHAEATSEKRAMGFWADGRLSLVAGTHIHIQTADAQVLQQGTGYITDLGMTGSADSIIGVDKESAIKRFLASDTDGSKSSLVIAEHAPYEVSYIVAEIDESTGKCKNINRYTSIQQKDARNSN